MRATGWIVWPLAGALLLAGCASGSRSTSLHSRLIRPAAAHMPAAPAPHDTAPTPDDSLETVMAKVRELSARARPVPKQVSGATIESFDPTLRAALLALTMLPDGPAHRRVAQEYARVRIFDAAHKHYRAALALNPYDGAAYDGLARLWRDARLPWLGLGEAQRAVYYAPRSAEARNTLGTVLQALGHNEEAQRAYESALALDPSAVYALNNLGYLALVQGNTKRAIRVFREAIATDRTLTAARHNLALAYAAANRLDWARQALIEAGPPAQADYNLGIINLAEGRRADAMAAFVRACRTDRTQPHACARANALKAHDETSEGGTP